MGTILSKTFSYRRDSVSVLGETYAKGKHFSGVLEPFNDEWLIETRILVKTSRKWYSIPYVWNKEQTDADLAISGKSFEMTLDRNQRTFCIYL